MRWPRAWEGNCITGHEAVRTYWTQQWQELAPHVELTALAARPDGRLAVSVRQVVKDQQGQVVFEDPVTHVYTFGAGLITQMDIEQA